MTSCLPEITFRIGEGMHLNCVSRCCDDDSDDEINTTGGVPESQTTRESRGSGQSTTKSQLAKEGKDPESRTSAPGTELLLNTQTAENKV